MITLTCPRLKATYRGAVDRLTAHAYSDRMAGEYHFQSSEADLKRLEHWVDELIRTCRRLKLENRELRAERDTLSQERDELVERTQAARTQVETILERIKSMEQGS